MIQLPKSTITAAAKRVSDAHKESGFTGTFVAYLGKGDGTGTIASPLSSPGRQVWYHERDAAGLPRAFSIATLLPQAGIAYPTALTPTLEGLAIVVGYAPSAWKIPGLCVIGSGSTEGIAFTGNLTPIETTIATSKLVVSTADGALSIPAVTNIIFPIGALTSSSIAGQAIVTFPVSTGGGGGGGGGGGTVAAAGIDPYTQKAVCVTSASTAMSNNTSGTTHVNFDTKTTDTKNAVTTGTGWVFTAQVTGLHTVTLSGITASGVGTGFAIFGIGPANVVQLNLTTATAYTSTFLIAMQTGQTLYINLYCATAGAALATGATIEIDWQQYTAGAGNLFAQYLILTSILSTVPSYQLFSLGAGYTLISFRVTAPVLFPPGTTVTLGTLGTANAIFNTTIIDITDTDISVSWPNYKNTTAVSVPIYLYITYGTGTIPTTLNIDFEVI